MAGIRLIFELHDEYNSEKFYSVLDLIKMTSLINLFENIYFII